MTMTKTTIVSVWFFRMVECLLTLIWSLVVDISIYYVVTLIMWMFTNWILHTLVHYAVHGKHIGCFRCLVSTVGSLSVSYCVRSVVWRIYTRLRYTSTVVGQQNIQWSKFIIIIIVQLKSWC